MFEYKTRGVCSTAIRFNLENGKVHGVVFENGCNGNLKGIALLVEGMDAAELTGKLKGVTCGGKGTSCPAQLALAVEAAVQNP
ncbi:MAG: TIGR03905 family TSCPD domain-containing protein [Spirochaetaceae bacterium]|jgi:uncharacterized protein (TIGR03905 family)|nr:TIGR03905 family TSCPD domain-containing protein [Spirochaetaceae bacterium]